MIKIISSKIEQRIFDQVIDELSKVDPRNLDESHIVIVPPRFSLTTEDQITKSLSSKGSFNIRVSSFERIANELEHSSLPYLGPEGGVMVLTKVLFEHKDDITYFKKSLSIPGFAEEMYTTIGKLKLSKISPEEFKDAAEKSGKFAPKNKEIALIYQWYEDYCKTRFLDSISRLNNLSIALDNDETIKQTSFYILGYQDFTEQDYILIEKLVKNAKDVFIGVILNEDDNYTHIYKTEQFERICSIAKKYHSDYLINEPDDKLDPIREKLLENVFTTKKTDKLDIKDEIKIHEASSKMEECIYAAKQIKRIIESGDRYNDISIVCLNDSYIPYIQSVGNLYDIPIYIDKRYVLSNHPLSIYLNELIDLKRYNLQQNDVLSFVKNYFFNEEYFDFELYVYKRNINRNRFLDQFKNTKDDDISDEERIRSKLVKLISPIINLPDEANVNTYTKTIRQFLVDANIEERLHQLSVDLGSTSPLAKVNDQILKKINKLIDLAENILGDINISFNEFASIFINGIFVDSASIIPLYLDSVFVGTDRNEYAENKHFIFIGCSSEYFPSTTNDTGIINDDNIATLKHCGVNFTPTNESKNKSSFINAHQLLLKATKSYIFTYNTLDGNKPSMIIDDIRRCFSNNEDKFINDSNNSLDTYSVDSLKQEYYSLLNKKTRSNEEQATFLALEKLMNQYKDDKDVLKEHKIDDNLSVVPKLTSVTEIENYYRCPYNRFIAHNLKAKEVDKGELNARIWGQITHETLEKFIDRINEVKEDNLEYIASEIFDVVSTSDRFNFFTTDPKNNTFLKILKTKTITSCKNVFDSLADSLFEALAEELRFTANSDFRGQILKGKDTSVSLVGAIDRVDTYKDYVRVIDYKSGSKYTNQFHQKYLENGTKLQLPIYLKVISDQIGKTPAGAFYMILDDRYTKEESKEKSPTFKLEGFFVKDAKVVKAMDTTVSESGSKHLYNVSENSSEIKGNKNCVPLTQEEFDELINKCYQKAVDAIIKLEERDIEPRPVESTTCDFCNYKNICMRTIEKEE